MLYCLTQRQLAKTLLPLGTYTKEKVREIANELGLINARKHDSQDICFVPDGDYANSLNSTRAELILTVILSIPKVIFSVNTRELSVTP